MVGQDDDEDQVSTDATTTTSFPPFEESTTTSVVDPNATPVIEVPAAPVSVAPVPAPASASTTSSVAAPPAPMLAADPAPCLTPPAQPPAGAPAGPVGVFAAVLSDGYPRLTNATGRQAAWRPRADQVVTVSTAAGKPAGLCLSRPDGAAAKRLTTPAGVGRPAISFDGARMAVRSGRSGGADLVVLSVEGADQKLILQASEVGDPAWLGNASAVVTCATAGGPRRLVSVPAGGGEPRVLQDACPSSPVASSPDGGRIAFVQGDRVVVLNVASRSATSLKIGTAVSGAAPPSWSPDGRRVAFAYSDAQGPALGILDLDAGNGKTPLRFPALTSPSWAPAGDLIAFVGTEGGRQALHVVKPDGTGRRVVTLCQTRCSPAAQPWASDGSSILLELTGAPA